MTTDLNTNLTALQKIDLHRHLEGSVRPATLADICRTHKVELPTYDPDELAGIVQLHNPAANLAEFFKPFRTIKFCFINPETIARVAYEAVEDAFNDNIMYMELRFSPEFMGFYYRLSLSEVMDGIVEGVEAASHRFATEVKLIVSISRDLTPESMNMSWPTPDEIVDVALKYADRGVVGLDLSGREDGFPPILFTRPFGKARNAGLGITVHAGEDSGAESVRGAIEHLGASRIGHGVRIVEDIEVMKLAMDKGIVLEVCPTSNVLTHAVDSIERHPIRKLYDSGVKVTINTDDPSVCGITLSDEYRLLIQEFGFSLPEIESLIHTAEAAKFR